MKPSETSYKMYNYNSLLSLESQGQNSSTSAAPQKFELSSAYLSELNMQSREATIASLTIRFGKHVLSKRGTIDRGATALLAYVVLWYVRRQQNNQILQTQYSVLEQAIGAPKGTLQKFFRRLENLDLVKRGVKRIKQYSGDYRNALLIYLNIPKINELLVGSKKSGGDSCSGIEDDFLEEELTELQSKSELERREVLEVIQDLRVRKSDLVSSNRKGLINYVLATIQNTHKYRNLTFYLHNLGEELLREINIKAKTAYTKEQIEQTLKELIDGQVSCRFAKREDFIKYLVITLKSKIKKTRFVQPSKTFADFINSGTSKQLQLDSSHLQALSEQKKHVSFKTEEAFRNFMLKMPKANNSHLTIEKEMPLTLEQLEEIIAKNLSDINKQARRIFSIEAAIYLIRKLCHPSGKLSFSTKEGFIKYITAVFMHEKATECLLKQKAVQSINPYSFSHVKRIVAQGEAESRVHNPAQPLELKQLTLEEHRKLYQQKQRNLMGSEYEQKEKERQQDELIQQQRMQVLAWIKAGGELVKAKYQEYYSSLIGDKLLWENQDRRKQGINTVGFMFFIEKTNAWKEECNQVASSY